MTCRYYLGLDRRAAKQAHQRYLAYEPQQSDEPAIAAAAASALGNSEAVVLG
jgi:hypothetical protein